MTSKFLVAALVACLMPVVASAGAPEETSGFSATPVTLPNPTMIDEQGQRVRLGDDLAAGKTVAIAFMFTSCTTVCPMTAQTFKSTQALLPDRFATDMRLVAVSVDPLGDTPARVASYMKDLGAPQGFSFLTGNTEGSDAIQRALTGQVARGMAHTAFIYIVSPKGYWTRMPVAGTTPQVLAERMRQASELGLTESQIAGRYFTNLPVVDQHGQEQRFYRDLIQGHTVVINTLFTRCADACPLIAEKLARVHALLGPQHDIRFVSISSDPAYDNSERLQTFAAERSLPAQWTLLTGKSENVAWLLGRLGLSSDEPSAHPTQVLVVNERTMALRRLSPAATPQQIAEAIRDADAAMETASAR